VFVVIVLGVHAIGGWLVDRLWFEVWPRHSPMLDVAALGITFAYIATMALPFVPGIEIGLVVMLAFGHSAIPGVYLATQCALLLSFLAGRLLSPTALIRLAAWLHLHGTRDLLLRLAPMEPADRIGYMLARAPYQWVGRLVRHRYISLAVLINLPGNAILGGAAHLRGGGGGGHRVARWYERDHQTPALHGHHGDRDHTGTAAVVVRRHGMIAAGQATNADGRPSVQSSGPE
jgi:hypothetical protein